MDLLPLDHPKVPERATRNPNHCADIYLGKKSGIELHLLQMRSFWTPQSLIGKLDLMNRLSEVMH